MRAYRENSVNYWRLVVDDVETTEEIQYICHRLEIFQFRSSIP